MGIPIGRIERRIKPKAAYNDKRNQGQQERPDEDAGDAAGDVRGAEGEKRCDP